MTLIYFPFTSPFTVNYWMYCSSQLFWFLSSTWWEGKWDAGNGIMPYSPQVTHTRRNMKLTMVSILVKGPNPQDTAGSPFWTTCQPQLLCPWWLQVSLLSSADPKQILSQHLHRFNRNSDCFFQGFAVIFTLTDPVHQSLWAAYHVFGLLSCGQGLCTTILTLTAAACVRKKKAILASSTPQKNSCSISMISMYGMFTGQNHPWAVLHVPCPNSGLCYQYRWKTTLPFSCTLDNSFIHKIFISKD